MFYIQVSRNGDHLHPAETFEGAVELGRQDQPRAGAAEPLFTKIPQPNQTRFVISRGNEETHIHRKHVRLEPTDAGGVRVKSIGTTNGVQVGGHEFLQPNQTGEYSLPVTLYLRDIAIAVSADSQRVPYESLSYRSVAPRSLRGSIPPAPLPPISAVQAAELEKLGPWLETILEVTQSATGQTEIYSSAARALVEVAMLDRGGVLLKEGGEWKLQDRYPPADPGNPIWIPSRSMLQKMERDMTAVSYPIDNPDPNSSTSGLGHVVSAPILDRNGNVRGALYGDRVRRSRPGASTSELLAVKLLAGGVASGLARLEIEREAAGVKKHFEAFFSKELVDELSTNPALLQGKDSEVTLLFADVKSFSTIVESKGPQATMDWLQDVLTKLSECVLQHGGVIVDYVGDEVFAMFGAPKAQPDHAHRACQAAVDMLCSLGSVNAKWQEAIGCPTQVTIGISTGTSRVGNTGSEQRFKYGAVGPHVNLASRVRGSTKYLGTSLIVTEPTMKQVGDAFRTRRLCRVKPVNISAMDFYEIFANPPANWEDLKKGYEHALELFEQGKVSEATRELGLLLSVFRDDGPSLQLLSRAVECVVYHRKADPVWELPGK